MKKINLAYTNGWYIKVDGKYCIFGSYNTYIAVYSYDNTIMYKDENFYSVSTSRQYNRWCREILGIDPKYPLFIKNHLKLVSSEQLNSLVRQILK